VKCNIGVYIPFVIQTPLTFFLDEHPFSLFEPRIVLAVFCQKKHLASYQIHKSSFTTA